MSKTSERIGKRMSVTFIKRSEIPEDVSRGREATTHTVAITDAGRIVLNQLSTKYFDGSPHAAMAFDGLATYLFREDSPVVKKAIEMKKLNANDLVTMKRSKKGDPKSPFAFNGGGRLGGLLGNMAKYGASVTYDYKGSGNQTFVAEVDEKNKAIKWNFPEGGKLTPRPVAKRLRKPKAAAIVANPGSTTGVPADEGVQELVI